MTDQTDLFTQMDQAADLMRRENPYGGKADLALSFRDIQKSVMPELTTEHSCTIWRGGKGASQGMGQHRRIRESQPAKRAIPLCVGAVLHDPGDCCDG